MSDNGLRVYEVEIGGLPHTMQLDDADAERLGVKGKAVDEKAAEKPANKARTASNKK